MNVLLFMTDQQRHIQHFPDGWEEENLPGLRRLKANGVSFEQATCNSCMCSPSRATMMSGLFPAQHGVKYCLEANMPAPKYPQVELSTDLPNLGTVMGAAGYATPYKGKWHCSKPANVNTAPAQSAARALRTKGGCRTMSTSSGSNAGTHRTRAPTSSSARPVAASSTMTSAS